MALTACITPPVSYGPVLCFHRPRLRDCGPAACFLRTFFSKTNYCKRCLLSQRPQHATPLHTSSDSLLRRTPQSSENAGSGQSSCKSLSARRQRSRTSCSAKCSGVLSDGGCSVIAAGCVLPTPRWFPSSSQRTFLPARLLSGLLRVRRGMPCRRAQTTLYPQFAESAPNLSPRGPLLCLMLPDRWAPLLPLPRPSGQDHSLPCGGSGRGVDVFPARKP